MSGHSHQFKEKVGNLHHICHASIVDVMVADDLDCSSGADYVCAHAHVINNVTASNANTRVIIGGSPGHSDATVVSPIMKRQYASKLIIW